MAVELQADAHGMQAQTPRELFSAAMDIGLLHSFDVSRDGQRFLAILLAPSGSQRPASA
jgi:hypothetical protein